MTEDREKIKSSIKLSAKLLNADKSEQKNYLRESRDEFYNVLGNKFRPTLEESFMPQKEKIFQDILDISDEMEILGSFPELIGKTFVGVFGFDRKFAKNFIESATDSQTAENLIQDTNLPAILISGEKNITAINDVGNHINLTLGEYLKTNSLWRDKIDISQILRSFFMKQNLAFKNIAVVYFPEYFSPETSFGKMILQKLDAAFVYTSSASNEIKNRSLLEEIFKLKNIPIKIVTDSQSVGNLQGDNRFKFFEVIAENGVFQNFETLNVLRKNYLFSDALKIRLLEIKNFYMKKITNLKEEKTQIAGDLALITMEGTKAALRELEQELRQDLNNAEDEFEKLRGVSVLLSDAAKNYETATENLLDSSENIQYRENIKEIWRRIFFQAIDAKDLKTASEYMKNLERFADAYRYIYQMIFQSASGENLSWDNLERLRRESDNEFVRRAKMRLTKELNFSEFDYMQIARDIQTIETPEEYYFRGLWEEHEGRNQKAVNYFEMALKQNFEPAGKKLFELAGNDMRELQILSNQMVPEANFALGKINLENKKYAAADRYFKLAAIKKYIPAIKILADNFFKNISINYKSNKNLSEDEKKQVISCIQIYSEILNSVGDVSTKEKVGDLYHILNDDMRALEWWQQCETADSYYKRGRLYQYQDGAFSQDLNEAEKFFGKAASLGHKKAAEELSKVQSWKANNVRRAQERSNRSYAPRVISSAPPPRRSSGGCVITSAACAALHKPDDCDELNTLRSYRDKMKGENKIIAALIEEYYRVAPLLVEKMDSETDSEKIYSDLWKNSIAETYQLIKEGKNAAATSIYIDMVQKLCEHYGVELSEGISKKIQSLTGK